MADIYQNRIHFVRGDVRVRLSMLSTFALTPGVAPNINAFATTYDEFALLKGDLLTPGKLEFFFTGMGKADLVIEPAYIVEAKIDQRGILAGRSIAIDDQGKPKLEAIAYKLFIADRRSRFVLPRGGHLHVGSLNTEETPAADWKTNQRMIEICLAMMGIGVIVGGKFELNEGQKLTLRDVPELPVIRDRDWRDAHAPEELAALLEELGLAFCLQLDGGIIIERKGRGAAPAIPADRLLSSIDDPGVDRRSNIVVISSAPTPITETRTISGIGPGAWRYVSQDDVGLWWPMDVLTKLATGYRAIELVNRDFDLYSVPEKLRTAAKNDWWRCLALDPQAFPHVNILRILYTRPVGPEFNATVEARTRIQVMARIARYTDEVSGWCDTSDMVPIEATFLHNAVGFDDSRLDELSIPPSNPGPLTNPWSGLPLKNIRVIPEVKTIPQARMAVIRLAEPLLKTGSTNYGPHKLYGPSAKEIADSELEVTVSIEAWEKMPPTDELVPVPFQMGFKLENGAIVELTDNEVRTAVKDDNTVIVRRPEWAIVRQADGEIIRKDRWRAEARAVASHVWADLGKPMQHTAVGFVPVNLSGIVTKIEIEQNPPRTTVYEHTWSLPRDGMYAKDFRSKAKSDHRGEARAARGNSNEPHPTIALGPGLGGAGGNAEQPVSHARIASYERDGDKWRWIYQATFLERGKCGDGYDHWECGGTRVGITLRNLAEEMNGASGLMGNGVDTGNLAGTGLKLQPIPLGRLVRVWKVPVFKLTGPAVDEWWCDVNNAIDGTCEEPQP